ncbi:DUF3020 family conserved fungal protein Spp41 [Schizosaccharomyces osmophilus]|uniref:DUF3020 family conserved fungal protein Spp41 n=1 Tax=Schizosaccharomyces osmophilus TaxID=2545709 RepID=A0AAE9W8F9_9SCHI|nr:DUF3020 family conserved fungal protein Spp41 [Schizosaccharomyces osmophilus]WBW71670.1 DUF3020 family conserved fungal protein Spp41 [Schizosaccharomyces osmophilus]
MTEDGLTKLNLEAFLGMSGNTQELLDSLGLSAIPDLSNLGTLSNNNNNSPLSFDPNDPSAAAFYIAQQVAAIEHPPPPRKMTSSEKTRSENRERKKRWREQNEERNKDNDLRCRVNKKAKKLFGGEPSIEKTNWIEAEFNRRHSKRKEKERASAQNSTSNGVSRSNSQGLLPDLDLLATNSSANAVLQGSAINNALSALAKDPNLIHNLLTQMDFDPSKKNDLNLGALNDVVPNSQIPQPEHELSALQEHNEAHDAAMRQFELERQQSAILPGLNAIDGLQNLPNLDFTDPSVAGVQTQSQAPLHPLISQADNHSIFSALSDNSTPASVADPSSDFNLSQVMPLDLLAPSIHASTVSSPVSEAHLNFPPTDISHASLSNHDSSLPMRPRSQARDKHRAFPYYSKRQSVTTPSSPYHTNATTSPQLSPVDFSSHTLSRPQSPPSFPSFGEVTLPPIPLADTTADITPPQSASSSSASEKSHALGFPPLPGQKFEFQRSSKGNK